MRSYPPLRRSLLFWSGILVMVFIGWAWWLSYRGTAWISRGGWSAENSWGGVSLAKKDAPSGSFFHDGYGFSPGNVPGFPMRLLPAPQWVRGQGLTPPGFVETVEFATAWNGSGTSPTHRASLELRFKYLDTSSWLVFIPHWLILFFTAGVWAALLVWWRRRMRGKILAA